MLLLIYETNTEREKAMKSIDLNSKNAIILAAGFGSRFIPITYEIPKGLVKVFEKPMIERQIEQLLEVSITDITIIVGYLGTKFEYLKEKYGVKMLYSKEYYYKNNLSSIFMARHLLNNTYILSSDNYMTENLFNINKSKSWYAVVKSNGPTEEWCVTIDDNDKIKKVEIGGSNKWYFYGPVYFSKEFSNKIVPLIEKAYYQKDTNDYFWEDVLKNNIKQLEIYAKKKKDTVVYEFDTIEELRKFDEKYLYDSGNATLKTISNIFKVAESDIINIKPIKSSMTNNVFKFEIKNIEYVCRIPGRGSNELVNRKQEYANYEAIKHCDLSEKIIFYDKQTDIKISKFEANSNASNTNSEIQLKACMKALKKLHKSKVKVEHRFDIERQIEFYEKLCINNKIKFSNKYYDIKKQIKEILFKLKTYNTPLVFSHIDANCDNCLILPSGKAKLIDWEYAGMCDPLIDIAMFAIYSYMNNKQLEQLMKHYFLKEPSDEERIRVYSYVALGGLIWALWAEYKESLGIYYRKYKLKMYAYTKTYINKVYVSVK